MKKYKYRKRFTYKGKVYNVYADTQAELVRKYIDKMNSLKNGDPVKGPHALMTDWTLKCIDTYKTGQKEVTRQKFISRVNHCILSQIGDIPVADVEPMDLQEILNAQAGKSKTQINEVYQALCFIFRHAKENHLRSDDPTEYLTKPSGTHHSRRALTPTERAAVLEVAKTDRRYYMYLLMLLCGCRPSEAIGCKGSDIQLVDGYYMLHIRGTKTALSDRLVPIPTTLLELIKDTPKREYIAQTRIGSKITNQQRLWTSFKRALNLHLGCRTYRNQLVPPYPVAPDLVPYCFRHEYCSDLARKHVDIRIAQKLMGHSDITLTANIYTHVDTNDLITAAELINGYPEATKTAKH